MNKVFFLFILVFLFSCSKSRENESHRKALVEINSLNDQVDLDQRGEVYSQTTEFLLHSSVGKSGQGVLDLAKGICELINNNNLDNPFEFEKIFSPNVDFQLFSKYMMSFKMLSSECKSSLTILDYYPLSIVKFELGDGHSLYGFFKVEKSGLVRTYYFLPSDGLDINHTFVKTGDGEKISTIIFKTTNEKRQTVFIKTPYLQGDGFNYYIRNAYSFSEMGYNVVIQSNRGAHASTGDFKWLHENNIKDSKETIDWITNQTFSNGEVLSYGVSYDGYNALAAAASNAKGLVSTIACSAPTNAATDSFTAGKTVEARLLSYIAERENTDELSLFLEKFKYLYSIDTPFKEFDNILYGRNISDWNDLVIARDEGSLDDYLLERSILEELKNSEVPIFFIAGSVNDQDGRDTVLAYDFLKKESDHPKNKFLYLHHEGHGCGPFWNTKMSKDFLDGNYVSLKNEYRDHSIEDYISNEVEKDFTMSSFDLISESTPSIINNRNDQTRGESIVFVRPLHENIVVNGPIDISFFARSSLFKSSVLISIFKSDGGDWIPLHSMMNSTSRVSLYFEDSSEGEYTAALPPIFFSLNKGDSLIIKLSASTEGFIDFFGRERLNYYELNTDAGFFEVIDSSIRIILPVEREQNLRG